MAAAAFVLVITAVFPKQGRGTVFDLGRTEGGKSTTAITLTASPHFVSYSAAHGSRGACKREHAHARSDKQQYRTPAIFLRPGGLRIVNNRRTANKHRDKAGAVEQEWLV